MRSIKATKRYLLTKKWIDGDTCKLILVFFIALIIILAIASLSIPPIESTTISGGAANTVVSEIRDIHAQEGMWRATNLVAILTIFQVLIGIVGLALLFQTLKATQKTIDFGRETLRITQETLRQTKETAGQVEQTTQAANRSANAAEKAEKAYVYPLVKAKFTNVQSSGQDGARPAAYKREIELKISVRNFGRTPTRGGKILTGIFNPDKSMDGDGWLTDTQQFPVSSEILLQSVG